MLEASEIICHYYRFDDDVIAEYLKSCKDKERNPDKYDFIYYIMDNYDINDFEVSSDSDGIYVYDFNKIL